MQLFRESFPLQCSLQSQSSRPRWQPCTTRGSQVALPLLRLARAQRSIDKKAARDLYERALALWAPLTMAELVVALPEAPSAERVKQIKRQYEEELQALTRELESEKVRPMAWNRAGLETSVAVLC